MRLLPAQTDTPRPRASFQFSQDAGHALREMWQKSLAAREERVACLASYIRNDTVFVTGIAPLEPEDADSMGISATRSVEECGPPRWSGTVHTHIALYTDDLALDPLFGPGPDRHASLVRSVEIGRGVLSDLQPP